MFHLQGTVACAGCCARLRAAMMIDVFNHFMPQAYLERLGSLIPGHPVLTAFPRIKPLWDVDARRALLDEFPGTQHVLSLANPPPELIGPPEKTPDLVRMANDLLAETCWGGSRTRSVSVSSSSCQARTGISVNPRSGTFVPKRFRKARLLQRRDRSFETTAMGMGSAAAISR